MGKNIPKERKEGMYKAILELKSLEECFDFFEDICAMTELRSMEQRFEVASMLKKEKVYTEIMSETNASSATISRVNRMINYGTGCLGEVIDRLNQKEGSEEAKESQFFKCVTTPDILRCDCTGRSYLSIKRNNKQQKGYFTMKQLMLGNKALARGLYEAGCSVVSSYPGTPSTEVTEEAAKYDEIYCEWAPNEKVAMEVAFGASLAGKRSFCGMKHVGLNVAADPLFTCSYTGVNGGMVICVADDPGMHSSQNEQDSRHHAIASKIPMLEPSDSTEAYEFAKKAFELSEEFDTPVIIKMCTRVAHSQSIVEPGQRVVPETIPYEKNIAKYVMMPGNAIRRHPVVEERTRKLIEYGNHCDFNRVEMGDTKLGMITSINMQKKYLEIRQVS